MTMSAKEVFIFGIATALILKEGVSKPTNYSKFITSFPEYKEHNEIPDYSDHPDLKLSNDSSFTNKSDGDYDPYDANSEDYIDIDYYDSFDICTDNSEAIIATDDVKKFSPVGIEPLSEENPWNHWTIVPKHKGGSVAVAKSDDVVSGEIFKGRCSDLHMFQVMRNSAISRKEWCHEKRLLSCDAVTLIEYNIFGFSPISDPGTGVDIVFTPLTYDYDAEDEKSFSIYYYECGGKRMGGDIRSPRFPADAVPDRVRCKWELDVRESADYGIVRFSGFSLPFCENHKLIIEEDTLLNESDVKDHLLKILLDQENQQNKTIVPATLREPYKTEYLQNNTSGESNADVNQTGQEYSIYVYRDSKISKEEALKNPKSGIHVVEIQTYCGTSEPQRTISWRRRSKNVTVTFISENMFLHKYGFSAKFSTFSWEDTLRRHHRRNKEKTPEDSTVPHAIFNYIILIVFVPIGLTIGLSIIILHIKKRGPTLRDFYRREMKERKLRRTQTERVLPTSPDCKRRARRTRSLDITTKCKKNSELAEHGVFARPPINQRSSVLSVNFLITGKRRRTTKLNTLFEEDRSTITRTTLEKPKKNQKSSGIL